MTKKVVRATDFQLVGNDGSLRASLSVNPDNTPNLRFFDAEGGTRFDIFLLADGIPVINVSAKQNSCRIALGLSEKDTPFLEFYDQKQKPICRYDIIEKDGDIEVVRRKARRR